MSINYYGEEAGKRIFEGVQKNAFSYMDEKTISIGNQVALTYLGTKITYNELKANVYKYVNKLKSYGLQKGECFSLVMPNTPETVYYKYAAWVMGAKVNLIDPRFNPEGILFSINMSVSKFAVVIVDKYLEKIVPIIDRLRVDHIVIVNPTDSIDLNQAKGLKPYVAKSLYAAKDIILNLRDKDFRSDKVMLNQTFMRGAMSRVVPAVYEPYMDASIVFTSGTTGSPKGAVLTHDAYNIKVNQIKYAVPKLYPGDRFLAAIPFFSAYGSFAGMHTNLSNGENLILIPNFKPEEFGDLVCKYRANTFIGVPKYIEDLEKNHEALKEKYGLDDLSFVINPVTGGDKIAPEVVERSNDMYCAERSCAEVIVGYGSSETAGPVMTTTNGNGYYDPKSTGVLMPGVKYLFLDPETGEILENGTSGELCIHDPGMMDRYLDDPKATEDITIYYNGDKYYKMGDLFSVNQKGLFYFMGRTKRVMMRPDGHTVHANPIEEAIQTHPGVDGVCVVGLSKKDGSSGTIPTAFIVLKEGFIASQDLVNEIDSLQLANWSERNRALAVSFIDELPYTLMTKVNYKALEKIPFEDIETYIVDYTFFSKDDMSRVRKAQQTKRRK